MISKWLWIKARWKLLAGVALGALAILSSRRRGGQVRNPPGRRPAGNKEYDDAIEKADRDLVRRLSDDELRYRESATSLRESIEDGDSAA